MMSLKRVSIRHLFVAGVSIRHLFVLPKKQHKKDIFFYNYHFRKAKSRLKDIFSYCRKDMKKISFRYFDTCHHSFASNM